MDCQASGWVSLASLDSRSERSGRGSVNDVGLTPIPYVASTCASSRPSMRRTVGRYIGFRECARLIRNASHDVR